MNFVFRRARSIARKEIRHIRRDPFTLAMALGMPVLLVTFFGLVIDFDTKDIGVAAFDRDHSRPSRELLDIFSASGYFIVKPGPETAVPLALLDEGKATAVVAIEPGFSKDVARGQAAQVQVVLDGADNQAASSAMTYLDGVQRAATERLTGKPAADPVELRPRFLFNPELNSRWFTVTGLAVVVIGLVSILLTALTVAREWETGSMELLLSTPVQPLEIILGKLAPYCAIGLGGAALVYLAARFGFGVPFRGNHLLYLFATLLFLSSSLAQGLLISVVTRQQQLAMQMANISGMLPSLLLSGFMFPTESMPAFFQYATGVLAPRWFMEISRGLFLRGAGPGDLLKPLGALLLINLVLMALAAKKFKKDLEP